MTCCAPIPSTISEKLNIGVLLGGLVAVSFQSTASSCKFSAALYSIFQHQNREDCHIVGWDYLWEEEDNIFFDIDIPCVIFAKIPRTMFSKRKYDASEGASELTKNYDAYDLSSNDRFESEIFGGGGR